MKSYIKSIIFLSCILVGGNYVFGVDQNKKMPEPKENITIIATFNIDEGHANKDVLIINDRVDYMTNTRTGIDSIEIYKLGNNNEHQFEHIAGKDKNGEIDKKYNFNKPGEYKIYYYFEEGITDMSYMFYRCYSLTSLDFSHFNTDNVEDMSYMFCGCSSLTSLEIGNLNTDNVMCMSSMFYDCSSLIFLDLRCLETKNVTDMSYMFCGCSSLISLDLSNFNTTNVKNMSYMFAECSSFTSLNLSNFNTDNVTNMYGMFNGCSSLADLNLSNFKTDSANGKYYLLGGCSRLGKVTTNDEYIKSLCKDKKVIVLSPNKKEEKIEIGDNQNLFKGDSQTQSNSNSCCCPCCKNK